MIANLLSHGQRFSFLQTMRLLRLQSHHQCGGKWDTVLEDRVRLRPMLSLGFPPADVDSVEVIDLEETEAVYRVTTRFLGLYGCDSPLPDFYTEDLIEEAREDESASRDFLDILNNFLYHLLFRTVSKYRLDWRVGEERDEMVLEILYAILGFGTEELRASVEEPEALLRYMGLFSQTPRSAAGLRALLIDANGEPTTEIVPCIRRLAEIPEDQRCRLGRAACVLGQHCYLGAAMSDRMGRFRIQVGPLDADRFHSYLPDGRAHEHTAFLARLYAVEPLECEIEAHVAEGEVETVRLGGPRWCKLGWNTWLLSGGERPARHATFEI